MVRTLNATRPVHARDSSENYSPSEVRGSSLMGRAGWLRGLLLVACLAGGDAYVVPTSQHVLQLAARRAASPPPRAPSTTATVSDDDGVDELMKVRRAPLGWSLRPTTVCVGCG